MVIGQGQLLIDRLDDDLLTTDAIFTSETICEIVVVPCGAVTYKSYL